MKSLLKLCSLAALLGALVVGTANATPITGDISISGSVQLDNQMLGAATAVTTVNGAFVTAANGSFSGTEGSSVNYSTFAWNPSNAPITPLWNFTNLGITYSFDLLSLSIVTQNNVDLILSGLGKLNVTGMDETTGTWRFSVNNAGGAAHANYNFGFTSSNSALPDSGSTALLLGLGVLGLAAAAKRRFAA